MKLTSVFPQIKTEKLQVKRNEQPAATRAVKSGSGTGDKVSISANSQDINRIKEVLAQTPEVRVERIKALKDQVERGEYQVNNREVANAMLKSLLTDYPVQ